MILTRLFCDVDDFCQTFIPEWEKTLIETGERKRKKQQRCISCSEIITLIVYYHQTGYQTFKWFYQRYLLKHLIKYFPKVPEIVNVVVASTVKTYAAFLV